ncbi:cell cycle control protein cwf19 [Delitschia confertaspora ATCC 74209]|uniref:Cell cycle control protein cwf19 n=1 Tax=Delitschia confertaspora ATCC 74209 TaxID=1513339 RepID=A0A9P4MTV2_9PLEO|nr:cell cycle control protein cwf19 [Delitschia confertaspora ATCC 74209]
MGLSDFERELVASKSKESRPHKKRERSRSHDREHRRQDRIKDKDREHRHRHQHSSRRDRDEQRDERRSHKRSRHDKETPDERRKRWRERREKGPEDEQNDSYKPRRHRVDSSDDEDRISRKYKSRRERDEFEDTPSDDDEELVDRDMVPPEDDTLDARLNEVTEPEVQRDAWMQAPDSLDVDYVQRRKKEDKSTYVKASAASDAPQLRMHEAELNRYLQDVKKDESPVKDEPAHRDVSYTFGDSGSQWRMTKLKAVYRTAEETGRSVEDVALERYGDLRDFDEAREEEIEVERRQTYGKDYVGKQKPSGELFEERKLKAGLHRPPPQHEEPDLPQGQIVEDPRPTTQTTMLDATALNKLKAQMLKAKMKGAGNAAQLEAEYNAAMADFANRKEPDVVILGAMENRMLAGGRKGEVKHLDNKRGRERGLVVENEDMSIEDMVRQERRTRGQPGGEGRLLAEKIAKDAKFDNDLDYIDENAAKLAQRAPKSDVNLRNSAIEDFQRTNRILDACPLCHHEDKSPPQPPIAPIASLATRVYLTLPTEPEISEGGAVICPIQHRTNLLECDDDEWDEIRNFMKCLTRLYHDQGRDVIFYENAAAPHRKPHAAMMAVPIPFELGETAPAFFREAILTSDEEWSQHKKIIDTLKASKTGAGKQAFRRSLAKEMPYFHVWFELDGGMGHVVEDSRRWPKGDLFAREVLGGMLDVDMEVVRRQGRWQRGDRRVEGFKKRWRKFDWTRVLSDG